MKTINNSLIVAALVLSAFSCHKKAAEKTQADQQKLKGTISISGAFALYPLANVWAEEFSRIHPGVRFNISAGGAGKGMADALAGAVDLGMFSREITPQETEKGAWGVAVAKDAVLPTINSGNPELKALKEKGLTRETFRKIFITGEIKTWGKALGNKNPEKISLYTRSDAAGAAATWAKFLGAEGQEELNGIGVFGDPGLADAVKNDRLGIGFNNVIYVYDLNTRGKYTGLEVIPIDVNGNRIIDEEENFYDNIDEITHAIGTGKYPSPPARELYFVANGKPEKAVVAEFLKWVLGEGQKFNDEAGYIRLPEARTKDELAKLTAGNELL